MSRSRLHMRRRASPHCALPGHQSGAALLIIVALVAAGLITTLLVFAAPVIGTESKARTTQESLSIARQALIGRAAADANRPGSLPCPDTNNDGDAEMFVGTQCPSYIGRLPWRTLGLPDLRDASGERLWYALPPAMRDQYSGAPRLNSNLPLTTDLITVTGTPAITDIAAIIIAPGLALAGQNRIPANANDPSHFLEGENVNGDNTYDGSVASAAFNDVAALITRQQLFSVVELRVANHIRTNLDRYYQSNGYYPYANDATAPDDVCTSGLLAGRVPQPDSASPCTGHASWTAGLPWVQPPSWFSANGWRELTYYALASNCTEAMPPGCGSGNLKVNATTGRRFAVIVGGRSLVSQTPPCIGLLCIEQPQAGINEYQHRSVVTAGFNDRLATNP